MSQISLWTSLTGGILIGAAAVLLLCSNGRIAGVSGIAAGLWTALEGDRAWRWLFLLGLVLGSAAWAMIVEPGGPPRPDFPRGGLVLAGLLVGYGTALAGGCTSGHGVCGLARRSLRSLVATLLFVSTAIVVTGITRHILAIG